VINTFKDFNGSAEWKLSSLDLHMPFSPLCEDKDSLLDAMSGGGRAGLDTPYIPRGCDMRWFSAEEICVILSRFHKVIITGDSIMRHVNQALYILLRKNFEYGGLKEWNMTSAKM
jgi:hypothetical protein